MDNLEKDHEVEELEEIENNDLKEKNDKVVNTEEVELKMYEPKFGMSFDSLEEMFEYYKAYGKQEGFPVMRRSSNKGPDGIVRYVTFACSRSGQSRSNSSNALRPQFNAKNGCNARFGGCLDEDGKWVVRTLILKHNHELSQSKAKYFSRNRIISSSVKRRLAINDRPRNKIAQNINAIDVEVGGRENVPFVERDVRNFVNNERRLWLREGDAIAIQRYFLKMQSKCDGFIFSIDLDKEGRLKNVFWADPRSRAAYKDFGDLITLDTTYLTDKYDLPLVLFLGVNHHGQFILLGSGLILHEDTETFTWLFRTWLSCMSSSSPIGIITDQDEAIKKAIEIVFPESRHRWCLWHILKKVPEKLWVYKQYNDIVSVLQSVIYDSNSLTEFEESWNEMIVKYDLGNNEWLCCLYDERHRWVPCFVKNCFWAGMSTTQRSESMNAFYDGFVNSKTTLKQFMEQYDNALRSKVKKECQADVESFSQQIPCVSTFLMEKQVQEVYTISKFQEFQQELVGKIYCDILSCVGSLNIVSEVNGDGKNKTFEVNFEKDEAEIRCSCSRFELRGILCRHAIAVLVRNSICLLPEKYIIQRWRKDVRRHYSKLKFSYNVRGLTTEQVRYEKMCAAFIEVANIAADDVESYKLVLNWIEKTRKDLPNKIYCKGNETNDIDQGSCSNNEGNTMNDAESIHDPVVTSGKGCLPSRRKESTIFKETRQKTKKISSTTSLEVATVIPRQDSPVNDLLPSQGAIVIARQESNVDRVSIFSPPHPPQASILPYFPPWMSYGGSQRENFQQDNKDGNYGEVRTNVPDISKQT